MCFIEIIENDIMNKGHYLDNFDRTIFSFCILLNEQII